jgi:hypothetical protein
VDETGSGLWLVAGTDISGIESSGSTTTVLVTVMRRLEIILPWNVFCL